jgi:hypothetical protein
MNTTVYVFKLNEDKYYISEFNNDIIEPIEKMIEKLVPNNDSEKIESLLTQNLGTTISSLEWIKKYPIKSVCKTNYNLEKITSNYMRNHGIDNVRSDLYQDVELSEDIIKDINLIINESSEPISKRIKQIDFEISKFKKIFDIITTNNNIISKYEKYPMYNITQYVQRRMQEIQLKIQEITTRQNITYAIPKGEKGFHTKEILNDKLYKAKRESEYINQKYQELCRNQPQNGFTMNLISPDFKEILNDKVYKDFFSDHKIVEEIANASLLQKKNEKLIFKYGTLDKINEKLSTMLYKKIDLINSLEFDDFSDD